MPPTNRIPLSVRQLLRGKDAKERATIKGIEIAKVVKKKRYKRNKLTGLWS